MPRNSFEDHTEIYKNDLAGWQNFTEQYSNFVYDEQRSFKEKEKKEMEECADYLDDFDYSIGRVTETNYKLEQEVAEYKKAFYEMKGWERKKCGGRLTRVDKNF